MDLKRERISRGWSQMELAKKLGVSRGTISNYESDGVIPKTKLPILAQLFSANQALIEKGIYYEKDGVKSSVKELAVFFVEHEEVFMEDRIFQLTIDRIVARKINDRLRKIIQERSANQ